MKPLQFATPEDPFQALYDCYRSGQMSERQWQAHLSDPLFRIWLERKGIGA